MSRGEWKSIQSRDEEETKSEKREVERLNDLRRLAGRKRLTVDTVSCLVAVAHGLRDGRDGVDEVGELGEARQDGFDDLEVRKGGKHEQSLRI